MPHELIQILIPVGIYLYFLGSYKAVELLINTIKLEKLLKEEGLDYTIKHKCIMFVLCGLFSWFAYSALKRQQK